MAAGVTVPERNIDELRRRISELYSGDISSFDSGLKLDFEVEKPELLSVRNVEELERLEPFGSDNPPPNLCITGATLTYTQPIGSGLHSRLKVEKSGVNLDCIYFAMPSDELDVCEGMQVDVAFEPQINDFRGRSNVQLQVFDIKES